MRNAWFTTTTTTPIMGGRERDVLCYDMRLRNENVKFDNTHFEFLTRCVCCVDLTAADSHVTNHNTITTRTIWRTRFEPKDKTNYLHFITFIGVC